jgi:hypothetical protein
LFRDEWRSQRKKSGAAGFGRAGRRSVSRDKRPGMVVFAQAKSRETNGVLNAGTETRELNAPLIEGELMMI